jgi:hypothetical protein
MQSVQTPNGRVPLGSKQRDDWRLDHDLEAQLEWFWCFGASLFERSTFGSELRRAELMSCGTVTCIGCEGHGFTGIAHDKLIECKACKGRGDIPYDLPRDPKAKVVFGTDFCPDCNTSARRAEITESIDLTGWTFGELTVMARGSTNGLRSMWCVKCSCGVAKVVAEDKLRRGLSQSCGCRRGRYRGIPKARVQVTRPSEPAPSRHSVDCKTCNGDGYVETNAVMPMSSADDSSSALPPDSTALQRYAVISRALCRIDAAHAWTLERYYGLIGLHWGRGGREKELDGCDRLWSIIPGTPAGKTLLAKIKNPLELGPNELLENLVASQKLRRDDIKAQQLSKALGQAADRYRDACAGIRAAV